MTAEVFLHFPTFKGSLTLERTPRFLRFTVKCPMSKGNWDALDQLTDEAADDEQILIGELIERKRVHILRTVKGKRVGEWIDRADYKVVDDGPGDEVLRSNNLWREWCLQRMKSNG